MPARRRPPQDMRRGSRSGDLGATTNPFFRAPTGLADGLARKDRATPKDRRFAPGPLLKDPLVPPFPVRTDRSGIRLVCTAYDRRGPYPFARAHVASLQVRT